MSSTTAASVPPSTGTQPLETQKVALTRKEIMEIMESEDVTKIRNVAIIAHVDHGQTTLVDTLLRQTGCSQDEGSMDSNALEKEQGITILSKVTGVAFKGHKINIVDTPGHSDFGGEVERILSMVDGVILLVCATEGPMTQTQFVLQKAIQQKLKPIVIINKVDRPTARIKEVENEIFSLFCDLETHDDLLDYPIYYASGRSGWAVQTKQEINKPEKNGAECILDAIVNKVPHPQNKVNEDLSMLVTQTESNKYLGRLLIGKINSGILQLNDQITSVDQKGTLVENGQVLKVLKRYGFEQIEIAKAVAGDIVSFSGLLQSTVSHTINPVGKYNVIKSIPIDPPIIGISINVNTSPLAGKDGTKLTKSALKTRLTAEAENDVALRVNTESKDSSDIVIEGRGDLHLGILLERLRREGYEMSITPPIVIMKKTKSGGILEPMEKVIIECHPQYVNGIIQKISNRMGNYEECTELNSDLLRLSFAVPTRGMIGFRSELLNETKGSAVIFSSFQEYVDYKGPMKQNLKGAIVAHCDGVTTAWGINEIEKFGTMFIVPGQKVYAGMVIGEHNKEADVDLNPTQAKKLTNVRSVLAEQKIVLTPPRQFSLEDIISYIRDDELVEVTPNEIRIRQRELDAGKRAVLKRNQKQEKERMTFAKEE